MENKIERIKEWFKKPLSVVWFCVAISLFTLVAYHKPLFSYVVNNVESGFSGALIVISFVVLLLVFNFMFSWVKFILTSKSRLSKWLISCYTESNEWP